MQGTSHTICEGFGEHREVDMRYPQRRLRLQCASEGVVYCLDLTRAVPTADGEGANRRRDAPSNVGPAQSVDGLVNRVGGRGVEVRDTSRIHQ